MSENTNTTKRRSAIQIMGSLIGLVKPLLHIMLVAIILGTLGYLCAIFLTILAGQVIMHGLHFLHRYWMQLHQKYKPHCLSEAMLWQ